MAGRERRHPPSPARRAVCGPRETVSAAPVPLYRGDPFPGKVVQGLDKSEEDPETKVWTKAKKIQKPTRWLDWRVSFFDHARHAHAPLPSFETGTAWHAVCTTGHFLSD